MAKRIIWSARAEASKNEILEYWFLRIGNKRYSKKLFQKFQIAINQLALHPFIGRKAVEIENVYFLIVKDYKIFYSPQTDQIEILYIWDTRRDPDKLKI
jgi:plasmid stabilization system protein ParE